MFIRNLLLAVGALCLAGGVALSVLWYNQMASRSARAPEQQRPAVLVAARDVPAGRLLRPEDMTYAEVATSEIRPGALVRGQMVSADFVGAVARRPFAANEQFVSGDLIKPSERQFLSAALKPGMRAVSIAVDSPQSSAGLLLPGDQVDVILTQSFGDTVGDAARKTVAETVLRDVRIIAVDQTLSTTGKAPRAGPAGGVFTADASRVPKTVTFEVTEREAERLFVAAQLGRLQLSVRPLEIVAAAAAPPERATPPVWASDVSPALTQLPRAAAQPASGVEAAVRRPPARADDPPESRP